MKIFLQMFRSVGGRPGLGTALIPVVVLIGLLVALLCTGGTDAIADYGTYSLLVAAAVALLLSFSSGTFQSAAMKDGMRRSAAQILPAVPLLLLIALISTTWMLSGIVPTLIHYGLEIINPTIFPLLACVVCAVVAVLTGSSWSSIATIGVAFMGIGEAMGFNEALTAGAIISGAYFGDKVSPLSDTTVVASSACGVDIFRHIRYMMVTSIPAMLLTLVFLLICGFTMAPDDSVASGGELSTALKSVFVISPWLLIIPVVTGILIALKLPTLLTMGASALMGFIAIFVVQDNVLHLLGSPLHAFRALWDGATLQVSPQMLSELTETSGMWGMASTIFLILSAMIFGGIMMGSGMLSVVTASFTRRLRRRTSTVGATAASGLILVGCTADQYLSLIVAGNMYRDHYSSRGLDARLLSRTLEDSITVTCPLIPWSSCGVTQSTVLGVGALAYAPFAVFCWLSPLMTILVARLGLKIAPAPAQEMQLERVRV